MAYRLTAQRLPLRFWRIMSTTMADRTLASQIPWLLDELCVEMGFCLPAHVREALIQSTPKDVEAFTEVVFAAEGLDSHLHKQLRHSVMTRSTVASEPCSR
jgi:hypothetical protein